eukprot:c16970_g1_i2.p1 GENE.c16970_g1_i2~~c16970_g1_i2.p1  ORF type:complete len:1167 (+),score=303.98 c16970_g1_i2:201-3503(+)
MVNLQHCLNNKATILRETALHSLRHLTPSPAAFRIFSQSRASLFVCRCLERRSDVVNERVQALKFVRHIISTSPKHVPFNITRSLVAIANDAADPLRRQALETLRQLSVVNAPMVAVCQGIRAMGNAALDPTLNDIAESLVITFMYLVNEPHTRKYLRSSLDVCQILSPLTDFFCPDPNDPKDKKAHQARVDRMKMSHKAVVTMMHSWTGVVLLTSDPAGLMSLVQSLLLPPVYNTNLGLHNEVFQILNDILKVALPRPDSLERCGLPPRKRGPNIIRNYSSIVLLSLIHVGTIEVLMTTAKSDDQGIARQSTALLGRMLMLSASLLPPSHCVKLQSLPQLVTAAASFGPAPLTRIRANEVLNALHAVSRTTLQAIENKTTKWGIHAEEDELLSMAGEAFSQAAGGPPPLLRSRPSLLLSTRGSSSRFHLSLLVSEAAKLRRMQGDASTASGHLECVRRKVDSSMDDAKFNSLLTRSAVLVTKDSAKWQWDCIQELLEGPLHNPQRLKDTMTNTKFIKRLLSFMRPSKKLFWIMTWAPDKLHYVRVLCCVVELLAASDDGIEYLKTSNVFQEVERQLAKIDNSEIGPAHGTSVSLKTSSSTTEFITQSGDEAIFGRNQVSECMAREYFTLLGFLTKTPRGLEFLKSIGMFKTLNKVCTSHRDDLKRLMISSLDYKEGACRSMLAQLLTVDSKPMRLHCTKHLRLMLRAGVPGFENWGVEDLKTQLSDKDEEVALAALDVLMEACTDAQNLEAFVRKRPNLKDLGKPGRDMMIRMLSTELGVRYLDEMQWIGGEMDRWMRSGNIKYVQEVEMKLVAVLHSKHNRAYETTDSQQQQRRSTRLTHDDEPEAEDEFNAVVLPPHFFGALCSTHTGLDMLNATPHLALFASQVASSSVSPLQRRAALWALGHIGASPVGLQALERINVVKAIVSLAQEADCLSLRGTCCYALGLISRTIPGRTALEALGWASPPSLDANISVPCNPAGFFTTPITEFKGSATFFCPDLPSADLSADELAVFKAASDLSNAISKEKAKSQLTKFKSQQPTLFKSMKLFVQLQELLAFQDFSLSARRFIANLFETLDVENLQRMTPDCGSEGIDQNE